MRAAGATPDERMAEAVDLVRSKRDSDGRWLLENPHPGFMHFAMDDGGAPVVRAEHDVTRGFDHSSKAEFDSAAHSV